ncbi:MAG: hypothetical protein JRF33_06775 [Deltaproteobacteria bacterium]|nr:hypothetical protein [Deltaproteobacteria bacterium]
MQRLSVIVLALSLLVSLMVVGCGADKVDLECMDDAQCVELGANWRCDLTSNTCHCVSVCTDLCCGDDGCGGACGDPCADQGETCNTDTCRCESAVVCEQGETRCDGELLETCDNNAWSVTLDCSANGERCVGGRCISPLLPPEDFHGLHVGTDYRLRWQDPNRDEEHYLLERKADAESDYVLLAELAQDTTEYLDVDFSDSANYRYRLSAIRAAEQSDSVLVNAAFPLWTYIRIVDYDSVWGGEGTAEEEYNNLIEGHWTWDLEWLGANENLSLVMLGDALGDGGSVYAGVDSVSGSTLIEQPELQMDVVSTYEAFFDWVLLNYPAQRYVVEYWGHGGGTAYPAGTLGYDDTSGGDGLTLAEMADVLGYLAEGSGRRVDLLYLCTCLNGMFESAYEWRHAIRWFVAGETSVGCVVQPLEKLMGHEEISVRELAQATVDGFDDWVDEEFRIVYSAVDTDFASAMAELLDQLAQSLLSYIDESSANLNSVRDVAEHVQCMDGQVGSIFSAYIDLYDFCDDLSVAVEDPDIQAQCVDIMTLLEGQLVLDFVQLTAKDWDEAHGISIYHPNARFHDNWPGMQAYYQGHSLSVDTYWDDYLMALYPQ